MTTAIPTLVAVHLPKTAGTSFRAALEHAYGGGLYLDYDDRPLTRSPAQRRAQALLQALRLAGRRLPCAAVYGHFLPLKYATVRGATFAVWLRDPVQRLLSRYQHYLRDCAAGDRAHARWGLRPGLSLEQFVRLPHYQNTYSQYFWGFPLARFDFIGFTENYAADLARFARHFELAGELPVRFDNVHGGERGATLEPAIERLIRRCNAADIALYARARELPAAQAKS